MTARRLTHQLFFTLNILALTLGSPSLSFSAELGSGSGSDYPGTKDADSTLETTSTSARSDVPNDLAAAIVAIQGELGTDPAGSLTDVKSYLQTEHAADGTHGTVSALTIKGASPIILEGATDDANEVTIAIFDEGADTTIGIPDMAENASFMMSTLDNTANDLDDANAIWGESNNLAFEGATADGFEARITLDDPTADRTVTISDESFRIGLFGIQTDAITSETTASTHSTYQDMDGLSISVTAVDAQDQFLILVSGRTAGVEAQHGDFILDIGGNIAATERGVSNHSTSTKGQTFAITHIYAPGDTSAHTVKVQWRANNDTILTLGDAQMVIIRIPQT